MQPVAFWLGTTYMGSRQNTCGRQLKANATTESWTVNLVGTTISTYHHAHPTDSLRSFRTIKLWLSSLLYKRLFASMHGCHCRQWCSLPVKCIRHSIATVVASLIILSLVPIDSNGVKIQSSSYHATLLFMTNDMSPVETGKKIMHSRISCVVQHALLSFKEGMVQLAPVGL
jgi:hypothetical protein